MIQYERKRSDLKHHLLQDVIGSGKVEINHYPTPANAPFPGYLVSSNSHRFIFKPIYDKNLHDWSTVIEYSYCVANSYLHGATVFLPGTDLLSECRKRANVPLIDLARSHADAMLSAIRSFAIDRTK